MKLNNNPDSRMSSTAVLTSACQHRLLINVHLNAKLLQENFLCNIKWFYICMPDCQMTFKSCCKWALTRVGGCLLLLITNAGFPLRWRWLWARTCKNMEGSYKLNLGETIYGSPYRGNIRMDQLMDLEYTFLMSAFPNAQKYEDMQTEGIISIG